MFCDFRPCRIVFRSVTLIGALLLWGDLSPLRAAGDCPGDVNGDNEVNIQDLGALLACYNACTGDPRYESAVDFDGNGCIDLSDLGLLLSVYGTTCVPSGDDCNDPIRVTISAAEPFFEDSNTTCGHGDEYDGTCLGDFDDGEDIVYELTVVDPMTVDITLYPTDGSWTAFALDEGCPPDGACVASSTCASGAHGVEFLCLDPGVYYLMVDTRPAPECIADYTLMIGIPPPHCPVECPPGADQEGEPCGSDLNGGCGLNPPAFEPLTCGETVCGTLWAVCGERDTDWYQVTVTEDTQFTWSVQAEVDVLIGLIETDPPGSGDCWDMTGMLDPYAMGYCCDEPLSTTTEVLPAGTYWFYVSHAEFELSPCGDWSDYVATLSCETPPGP